MKRTQEQTGGDRLDAMPYIEIAGARYRHSPHHPEYLRWRGMIANMRSEQRMTRELGLSLLAKARKLPHSSYSDLPTLEQAFYDRFGREDLHHGGYGD